MLANRCKNVLTYPKFGIVKKSTAASVKLDVAVERDADWDRAKPYSELPGCSSFGFIRSFMPGGKYVGMGLDELIKATLNEFGPIARMPGLFGRHDMVYLFDPKDMEYVMRNSGPWPHRRGLETMDYYRYNIRPDIFSNSGGLLTEQGEQWQKSRTILNPIMMQPKVVEKYAPGVDAICLEFIENLKECIAKNEPPTDFLNNLNKWSLESIALIAIDARLGIMNQTNEIEFIKLVREMFDLLYELDILPSIWKYYKTPKFNRLMEVNEKVTEFLLTRIDEAIVRINSESDKNRGDSELSVFEKCVKIDKNLAFVMAYDMLLAGVETTSTTAVSTLYLLSKNPDKQDLLRQEIKKVLPDKRVGVTSKNINDMPYLRACLKEGMRILPIGGVNLRSMYKDSVIKGYQIPKGTDMIFPHLVLQQSDEYFPKSKEFIPERWLKNQPEGSAGCPGKAEAASPFAFMPFGFGSRACIGKRFAELEMSILIIRLIQEFELGWSQKDLKYKQRMTNSPDGPVKFDFKAVARG